ncbi:unnamed protein product [Bemisia tabaci]|uniref:J domain-containing protein n=1 Tax=Bemisia tabaci TaxID=7038 RepID=A0A9P0A2H1_BEMTA|nr:PREDICTED: dnaJ homolog subfamily C member 28-like [Bemisia tabaci]XP_018911338.1 PREDICTED: dnaJ homolog subfamily C member 28-like [Bemisia tabaci]CAH0384953.1 unnamed protein product [Bemisia tabaci]
MVLNRVSSTAYRLPPKHNLYVTIRGFRSIPREDYKKYYSVLGVKDGCDQEDVRRAFVSLVKKYHPDSDSPGADTEKFREIEHAYRMLQNKFAKDRHSKSCEGEYGLYYEEKKGKENSQVKEFDIKHTAPQHRQYLSYDGQGIGTPSERQKQHQKLRAATAVENVYSHRIAKLQSNESLSKEDSLIIKDKKKSKDIKTRYGMERLVEDLIQESMARGEFDNLQGVGKPLRQYNEYNPYVDFTTHKMNQIMIDNGYMPAWITLQKEIREEIDYIKSTLAKERAKYGPHPISQEDEYLWLGSIEKLGDNVVKVNKKIGRFNLVVPIMKKQMLQFDIMKEANKILIEGESAVSSTSSCPAKTEEIQNKEGTSAISDLINIVLRRVSRQ